MSAKPSNNPPAAVAPRRRFEGAVAVVTGSAWGLGRNHAERLAAEGARLVLADVLEDRVKETAASLPGAIAVRCDVSKPADTERLAAEAVKAFGRIDILVNNAGGAINAARPFWELSEPDWDTIIDVNLKGTWNCTRAVLPSMRAAGRGKIVNISSTAALRAVEGRGAYGASKGGVVSLTYTMASELGPFGITVNAVAPGLVEVPHPKKTFTAAEYAVMKEGAIKSQPIKRVCTMDDISDAVLFLVSSESDFVTGQVLAVNGGNHNH
jgi:NAD(P)-dependent dehydrogenase (short-subunit alcohol dehydrogenase family)